VRFFLEATPKRQRHPFVWDWAKLVQTALFYIAFLPHAPANGPEYASLYTSLLHTSATPSLMYAIVLQDARDGVLILLHDCDH